MRVERSRFVLIPEFIVALMITEKCDSFTPQTIHRQILTKWGSDSSKFASFGRRSILVKSQKQDLFDIFDDDDEFDQDGDLLPSTSRSSSSSWKAPQSQIQPQDTDESEFEDFIPQLNIVTLVGRVTWNPEPRYFDDGKVVVNVGLAVTRKYHPLERAVKEIAYGQEETDYFTLEVWGRDAEFMSKYITKGARIGVTGSLVIDQYLSKTTNEMVSKPKILVKEFDVLESKAEADRRKQMQDGGGYGNNNSNRGGGSNRYNSGSATSKYDDLDSDFSAGSGGFFG